MKTFTKTIAFAVLTFSSIGFASAENVLVPADDYVTTNLCMVASQGNKYKLSQAIEKTGLTKRFIAENVKCNDLNFIAFIEQYGSNVDSLNNYMTSGKYSENVILANVASR